MLKFCHCLVDKHRLTCGEIRDNTEKEAGSRWQSRKMLNLPHPMNTSKLQLHMERLSLRTTWRLAEQMFYNQGYKKRTTGSLVGGEEKSSQDPRSWYVTQKKKYHSLGILPKEQGVWARHWVSQPWGLAAGRKTPWLVWKLVGLTWEL